ncbi:MAG: BamA/TamA family outer membrane protein, partial [Phaeodactylibacter sp.]|nr:BamA/TamA family outer membrane protein [Phaeodactylibacter sp.]
FYFPETRLGFGGAGVVNYYPGKVKSSRPSQWQVGAAYTLNKQILLYASYQYFLRENRTELFGELGYYDYFYFFYGLGNATQAVDEETYFVRFPRLRINALEQVAPNLRAGLLYKLDLYQIYETEEGGFLEQEQPTGFEGGVISTIGALLRYDTRDNINLPRKGQYITLNLELNDQWLGSPFSFRRLTLDAIQYVPIQKRQTVAFNLFTGALGGDAPFQELLFLGGSKKARGIIEGRFRDEAVLLLQSEYRFPLFWRFRGSTFLSAGRVAADYGSLFGGAYHLNYGAGLRFLLDPDEGIQLRLDIGFGSDTPNFYLTVGEAF